MGRLLLNSQRERIQLEIPELPDSKIMSDAFLDLSKIELGEINKTSTSEASHAENDLNAHVVEQHPGHPNQNRLEEIGFGK